MFRLRWAGLCLVLLLLSCSQRPAAVSVPDFEARRPRLIAILPVAFIASGRSPLHSSLQQNYLQSEEYAAFLRKTLTSADPTLTAIRSEVESSFQDLGARVVERDRVDRWLKRFMKSGPLNIRGLAGNLGVDSLALLNLYEWKFVTGKADLQRGTLRADFELTILNPVRGDVIWLDSSDAEVLHYSTANPDIAMRQLAHSVVSTTLKSYPRVEASPSPAVVENP